MGTMGIKDGSMLSERDTQGPMMLRTNPSVQGNIRLGNSEGQCLSGQVKADLPGHTQVQAKNSHGSCSSLVSVLSPLMNLKGDSHLHHLSHGLGSILKSVVIKYQN